MISDGDLAQFRALVAQISDPDEREEAGEIADDIEAAAKSGNHSELRRRLRQLGRFAARPSVEAVKIGLSAFAEAKVAVLMGS